MTIEEKAKEYESNIDSQDYVPTEYEANACFNIVSYQDMS